MPPTLVTDQGATITDFATCTVHSIEYLGHAGGWVLVPHLFVDRLQLNVNGIDTATLRYEIGEGLIQPGSGATDYADFPPLALKGKFLKITVNPEAAGDADLVWVGHVLSDEVSRDAVKDVGGTNKLVGKHQVIECVGLEWFLDRKHIDSAIVRKTGGSPDWVRVLRPMTFNGGPTADLDPASGKRNNRSPSTSAGSTTYDFADDFDTAELWTAGQIVGHILKHHTPLNAAGAAAPAEFLLDPDDALAGFLDGFKPTVETENRTVFELLNEIANPRRGLVWWTEYVESPSRQIRVRVQSLATSSVSLPGGGTLPANNNSETLDFDGERDVQDCSVKELGARDYHQVVVRGARMTSTLTVGMPDQTLVIDWSQGGPSDAGSEVNYRLAGKLTLGYDELSDEEKADRNDATRLSDEFYRVFCAFRIPRTWDGKSGDGGGALRNHALPILSSTGSVTGGLPIHVQGLRMLNLLRLKRGWDYSNPANPKPATPTASLAEFMPPFVLLQVSTDPEPRYQFCDKMRESDFATQHAVSAEIKTSYTLSMQQSVPGFRLDPDEGMNHALALGIWDLFGTATEPSRQVPEVDYRKLRATVCVEADTFCEGKWPTASLPANVALNVLTIDLGDNYRLDFLPKNTIVGLAHGRPLLASDGFVLRDDRKYLEDTARMAYEWYQLDRQSLAVTFKQIRNIFELGMLITAIGSGTTQENVNTVVSAITFEFLAGTMTVETHDESLDVRSVA